MGQRFYASPTDTFTWPNGAVGHRSGGAFDCLGPYAIVRNCPIAGTDVRLTCYATGLPDSFFSVPANTSYRGRHIAGYFAGENGDIEFRPLARCRDAFDTRGAVIVGYGTVVVPADANRHTITRALRAKGYAVKRTRLAADCRLQVFLDGAWRSVNLVEWA